MKVIFKEPDFNAKVIEIENKLEILQDLVGGYIEVVYLTKDIAVILDEEGKLKGYKPNICYKNDTLVGNCIFVGIDNDDFTDLQEEQIKYLLKELNK